MIKLCGPGINNANMVLIYVVLYLFYRNGRTDKKMTVTPSASAALTLRYVTRLTDWHN